MPCKRKPKGFRSKGKGKERKVYPIYAGSSGGRGRSNFTLKAQMMTSPTQKMSPQQKAWKTMRMKKVFREELANLGIDMKQLTKNDIDELFKEYAKSGKTFHAWVKPYVTINIPRPTPFVKPAVVKPIAKPKPLKPVSAIQKIQVVNPRYVAQWWVPSKTDPSKRYKVSKDKKGIWQCSCPSWIYQHVPFSQKVPCKHIKELLAKKKAPTPPRAVPAPIPIPKPARPKKKSRINTQSGIVLSPPRAWWDYMTKEPHGAKQKPLPPAAAGHIWYHIYDDKKREAKVKEWANK